MPARLELAGRAEALAAAGTPSCGRLSSGQNGRPAQNLGIQRWCSQTARSTGSSAAMCAESTVRLRRWRCSRPPRRDLRITPSPEEVGVADEDDVVTVHNPCLSGGALRSSSSPRSHCRS